VKPSPLQEAYFRFVRLFEALEGEPDFPALDDVERSLLNFIALHAMEGRGSCSWLETLSS
jgi:hypothetical protein